MRRHGRARGVGAAGAKDDQADGIVAQPFVVSAVAKYAYAYLDGRDARSPWADDFEKWADEHGLGPELRRSVKITILRLRMFSAVGRHARRRRR